MAEKFSGATPMQSRQSFTADVMMPRLRACPGLLGSMQPWCSETDVRKPSTANASTPSWCTLS
eukprot:997858-Rhodomonas_salina.1